MLCAVVPNLNQEVRRVRRPADRLTTPLSPLPPPSCRRAGGGAESAAGVRHGSVESIVPAAGRAVEARAGAAVGVLPLGDVVHVVVVLAVLGLGLGSGLGLGLRVRVRVRVRVRARVGVGVRVRVTG